MTEILLWRRVDLPGHEVATLDALDSDWKLSGTAVFLCDQGPCKLDYAVVCDSTWRTKSAHVSGIAGGCGVDLVVSADVERKWYVNGVECGSVEGCLDIDLGFSPSTNLLPIRRLALDVGEEANVNAAWLPFPELRFELLQQLYRREGDRIYRYETRGGEFVRRLQVNAAGFVTRYPGFWEAEFTR